MTGLHFGAPPNTGNPDGFISTKSPVSLHLDANHCSQRAACLLIDSRQVESAVKPPWEINFSFQASSKKPRITSTEARTRRTCAAPSAKPDAEALSAALANTIALKHSADSASIRSPTAKRNGLGRLLCSG